MPEYTDEEIQTVSNDKAYSNTGAPPMYNRENAMQKTKGSKKAPSVFSKNKKMENTILCSFPKGINQGSLKKQNL